MLVILSVHLCYVYLYIYVCVFEISFFPELKYVYSCESSRVSIEKQPCCYDLVRTKAWYLHSSHSRLNKHLSSSGVLITSLRPHVYSEDS